MPQARIARAFSPQNWSPWAHEHAETTARASILARSGLAALALIVGCKATPPAIPTEPAKVTFPARPTVSPPPFKVTHKDKATYTLVTSEGASDEQIEAILWQLRDAAHTHTMESLHLSQAFIDARSPNIGFDVYRGAKCASEKYTDGPLPCDASDHAAGEYTLGSFTNPMWDRGALRRADGSELTLWDSDAPYSSSPTHP